MTKKELVVMPKGYHHLTQDERCRIYALRKSGFSNSRIAIELDRSRLTIRREIKRNSGRRGYRHQQAQSRTYERRKSALSVPGKMTPDLCAVIDKEPGKGWSPEQISGRMRLERCPVGWQSIYNYVHTDRKAGGNLWQCLRTLLSDLRSPSRVVEHGFAVIQHGRGKKPNWKGGSHAGRGHIPGRVDISQRPAVVEKKKRIGDWEADMIIGKLHSGAIVSLVDRAIKYTLLKRVDRKTAEAVCGAMIEMPGSIAIPPHTIIANNGKEFADHARVSRETGADFFFARPYHSWERGLNEHTNGLVREYLPKATDFRLVSDEEVQVIADRPSHHSHRPVP